MFFSTLMTIKLKCGCVMVRFTCEYRREKRNYLASVCNTIKIYFNKYIKMTNTFHEIINSRRSLGGHCCSSGNKDSEVY